MNIIAHILMTSLVIELFLIFNKNFRESSRGRKVKLIILAFVFGVLIDIDHVYTFFKIHDIKSLQSWDYIRENVLRQRYHYRTFLQESGGLAIALVISIFIKSALPFLGGLFGQCVLDWMCNFRTNPLAPFYTDLEIIGFIKSNDIKTQVIVTLFIGGILTFLEIYRRKIHKGHLNKKLFYS